MRLPDFLIIGSMKCGTTTLYFDLATSPDVFFPQDKEPETLASDDVLSQQGRRDYAKLFEAAGATLHCGEASTGYTKLPRFPRVPERARAVLGPDVKLIYIVREPVARIISHHNHETASGELSMPLDRAVREYAPLIDYTCYAMQAQAWVEVFGRDHLRVVNFADYMRDRVGGARSLCEYLGARFVESAVDPQAVFNQSEGKPVQAGPFAALSQTFLYKRVVRPLVSPRVRQVFRRALLPKAPPKAAPPTPDTVDFIYDQLADDHVRLAALMGLPGPVWDRAKARAKHVETYERWKAEHAG